MTKNSNTTLRWLHISDFHLKRREKWSQDVVLRSLLEDVKSRYAEPSQIDFIFVTGDLAWSGRPAEYDLVSDFLTELLAETGVPRSRLLIVPGNHDIDRNEEEDAFNGARSGLRTAIDVDRFLSNEGRRRTIYRRQGAFRNFANQICDREIYSDSSYSHLVIEKTDSITVAVLLIDSSWLAAGGSTDAHKILVGEKQLIDMIKKIPSPALTIGLIHHPFSWLTSYEQVPIQNMIADNCQLLFRGHVHEDAIEATSNIRNRLNIFTAGAAFENRLTHNCYGFGTLDLLSGVGQCVIHQFRNDSKSWPIQEPVEWNLVEHPNLQIPLSRIIEILIEHSPPYLNYLACIVSQKVTEIPVCYGDRVLFLNVYDEDASSSDLGKCVTRIRHMVHWESCWVDDVWASEFQQLIQIYTDQIGQLSGDSEIVLQLSQRNEACGEFVLALTSVSQSDGDDIGLIRQVEALAAEEAFDTALAILRRAFAEGVFSDMDTHTALRIEVGIHTSLDDFPRANECVENLLTSQHADGKDQLLAAICRINIDDLPQATLHVIEARKLGVPFSELKRVAARIAGQTGDSNLITQLRG